jgi:hypothetical protein
VMDSVSEPEWRIMIYEFMNMTGGGLKKTLRARGMYRFGFGLGHVDSL